MVDLTAFNPIGFNNQAFQIDLEEPAIVNPQLQQDKGLTTHSVLVYLGPTLGWVQEYIKPELDSGYGTVINLGASTCVVLINSTDPVDIVLPDIPSWLKQPHYMPFNDFERLIWVKDIGYHATSANIVFYPFGTQLIDGMNSFRIVTDGGIIRLWPLTDQSGWLVG